MAQTTNPLADLYHTNGVTFAQATEKIQQYITWIPLKAFVDPFVIFGKDSLYELNVNKDFSKSTNNFSSIVGRKNPDGKEIISILKHLMSLATDKSVIPKIYVYMPSTDIIELFQPTRGTSTGIYGELLTRVYYEYQFTFKCDENFKFSICGIQSVKMDSIETFSIQNRPQPLCGQHVPSMFGTQPPPPTHSTFGTQPPPPTHSTFGISTKPSIFAPPSGGMFGKDQTYSIFGKDQPKSMFGSKLL